MAGWVLLGALVASSGHGDNSDDENFSIPPIPGIKATLYSNGNIIKGQIPSGANQCNMNFNKEESATYDGFLNMNRHVNNNSMIKIISEGSRDGTHWVSLINTFNSNGNNASTRSFNFEQYEDDYDIDWLHRYYNKIGYITNVSGFKYFRIRVIKAVESMPLNVYLECE